MKLSELINQLQRMHDLYPQIDPEIIVTEVARCKYGNAEPEFFCRTFNPSYYEVRTIVQLPQGKLFSERGPYINIFYEGEYMDSPEDFWNPQKFHEQTISRDDSSSSSTPGAGVELDQQRLPTTPTDVDGNYPEI